MFIYCFVTGQSQLYVLNYYIAVKTEASVICWLTKRIRRFFKNLIAPSCGRRLELHSTSGISSFIRHC